MRLYFATHNPHKLDEIQKLLPDGILLSGLNELGLKEEIPETADTIAGNSLQKTSYVYEKCQVACFGDDTGLEVPALNGEPGVLSARYAGPEKDAEKNMDLLLKKLEKSKDRSAQFKTVITFINETGTAEQFTGVVKGTITASRSGKQGFGYDPIFIPDGYEKTFAEMNQEEKNSISHRGIAFRKLIAFLSS